MDWDVIIVLNLRNTKHFPYSYRNMNGSLGEREIEVETRGEIFSLLLYFVKYPGENQNVEIVFFIKA